LYQLIKAEGTHKQYGGINPNPDNPHPSNPLHTNKYRQTFAFDIIGNMTNKSSTTNLSGGSIGTTDDTKLNYELDYEYDSKYAHRLIRAGNRYYRYDANGNITAEKDGKFSDKEEITFTYSYFAEHDVYGVDYGFDLEPPEDDPANLESGGTTSTTPTGGYRRDYTWNERNLLIKSDDKLNTVIYRYGDDGQRALKFTQQSNSETLYFNNFYSVHQVAHEPNHEHGLRVSKHIFVGNSRLVTAMTHADNNGDTTEQTEKRYYYHADHLQSAQFITNARGEQYEHIEYTPYGELWIEETAPGIDKLPFRFTGKELDEETGLYYYGSRYLDPKYSRWLSGDPALNDYIPKAPIDDEAKKHNENLPGMGGVFNVVNLHVYHYAGNNPVKYVDPDGRILIIDGSSSDDPNYVKKIEKLLDLASAASAEFKNMLDAIKRNKDITVKILPNNVHFPDPMCGSQAGEKEKKLGIPVDSDIYFSPDIEYIDSGIHLYPVGIIAHELARAYDNMMGNYAMNLDRTKSKDGSFYYNPRKEANAVNIENQVYLYFGYNYRSNYSGETIPIRSEVATKRKMEMWRMMR
ncbi:RHS repeat domain-containing protein, partial [Treponema putidum]|uniref:RHS repeat domain-containing protein n=2 Tax=Treponema putidum TaxID=221027 RepID=UPI0020113356